MKLIYNLNINLKEHLNNSSIIIKIAVSRPAKEQNRKKINLKISLEVIQPFQ